MSDHWRLFCVDCKEDVLDQETDPGKLKGLWGVRDQIVNLAALVGVPLPGYLEINLTHYGDPFPCWFFVEHKDHDVRVKSEYGHYFGECARRIDCECCGSSVACNMPDAHPGKCKRTKEAS